MNILRIYDPPECDAAGVPLDWERCRKCDGGRIKFGPGDVPCDHCDGYRSLKAAALAVMGYRSATKAISPYVMTRGEWQRGATSIFTGHKMIDFGPLPIRCEDCWHPMSDGTWEGDWGDEITLKSLLSLPFDGGGFHGTAERKGRIHFSRCDERCEHGAPARFGRGDSEWESVLDQNTSPAILTAAKWMVEASWRAVDVRTLGWQHDLRPEKLAVLCLRCWAGRSE